MPVFVHTHAHRSTPRWYHNVESGALFTPVLSAAFPSWSSCSIFFWMDVLFLKNWVVVDGSDVATINILSTVVQRALPLPLRRKWVLFFSSLFLHVFSMGSVDFTCRVQIRNLLSFPYPSPPPLLSSASRKGRGPEFLSVWPWTLRPPFSCTKLCLL